MPTGHRARLALASLLLAACAPQQIVPLDVEPRPLALYVDGERVPDAAARELVLRADRSHVVFVKKEGYRAQQVVLRSQRRDGRPVLEPERVEVRLEPLVPRRGEISVELEP